MGATSVGATIKKLSKALLKLVPGPLLQYTLAVQVSSIRSLKDLQATAVDSILIPWFAFQNHSVLAAEALVETVVALYRSGWSVERIQMELSFLTLQRQRAGMDQVQSIDSEMLLSFVLLIMITAKVCNDCHNASDSVAQQQDHMYSAQLTNVLTERGWQHAGDRLPTIPICICQRTGANTKRTCTRLCTSSASAGTDAVH